MRVRLHRQVASGLAGLLLLLSALIYPQIVPHAAHHAHHQTAMHGTVLCAWLCAAGQAIESLPIILPCQSGSIAVAPVWLDQKPSAVSPAFASRGPPAS